MFRSRTIFALATAAAVIGIALLIWPRSSTEEQIKEMLSQLATHGTFEGKIHPIALAQLSAEISKNFFLEQVEFEVLYQGEEFSRDLSRSELAQQIGIGRQMMAQLATRLEAVKVTNDESNRAVATFELRAMGRTVGASPTDYFLEIFGVTATIQRGENDEWRIASINAQDLRDTD
jgi:hypothetical protein